MEDDDDDADSVTVSAADHSFVQLSKESVSRSLFEGNSHSLWLMSGILSQLKASCLQSFRPSLVQHQYFLCICFFVLTFSVSCCLSGFSPVEVEGELCRSCYVASLPGSEVRVAGFSRLRFWSIRTGSLGEDLQPGEGGFLHLFLSLQG